MMSDGVRRFKARITGSNNYLLAVNKRGATVTIDHFENATAFTVDEIKECRRRMNNHALCKNDRLTLIEVIQIEQPE